MVEAGNHSTSPKALFWSSSGFGCEHGVVQIEYREDLPPVDCIQCAHRLSTANMLQISGHVWTMDCNK